MRKIVILPGLLCLLLFSAISASAQLKELTVEKIMRDPVWMGESPSNLRWSVTGEQLYFNWLKDKNEPDAQYFITTKNIVPVRAVAEQKKLLLTDQAVQYNVLRTAYVYAKDGDIFYRDEKGKIKQITATAAGERSPAFSFDEKKIVYLSGQNLFAWDIITGETIQLSNFTETTPGASATSPAAGRRAGTPATGNKQDNWLNNDQLEIFQILKERKDKRLLDSAYYKANETKKMREISLEGKTLRGTGISSDGRYVSYMLMERASGKTTIVPNYVTESGYTEDIMARSKVGTPQSVTHLNIYDRVADTIYTFDKKILPGINELPQFYSDYPDKLEAAKKENLPLQVSVTDISWSPTGNYAIVEVRSVNNKNRWLLKWDGVQKKFSVLDRQYDEAWIGGPGSFVTGWVNDTHCWFQSEVTGYAHVYIADITTGEKKAVTSGNYETRVLKLSNDKKYFYIITNETHPGEQHVYRLEIATGKKERITQMKGGYQVSISPDETYLAYLFSTGNQPWELYLQQNPFLLKKGQVAKTEKITNKAISSEWSSYPWREPEYVSFKASDGATVYARLYKPANPHPDKPAVIFVHGAGYLQNAHKWWSNYFREYMFHNLLADLGYHVLDIDFRASAGYGRDWRTGIYRYMGGKDLSDNVDGAAWLVKEHGVNAKNIGLYGGSYGGFITLMAMFTQPSVFAAGAALRPVTDWAQYNHGYTANILNEPFTDSIAYKQSSPLYHASGLKGRLLICHGMLDVNVHYQDVVKLSQKLIELGKDNWELASYPMEDHGFVEPSSWTDEYKRILKLFEETLKPGGK